MNPGTWLWLLSENFDQMFYMIRYLLKSFFSDLFVTTYEVFVRQLVVTCNSFIIFNFNYWFFPKVINFLERKIYMKDNITFVTEINSTTVLIAKKAANQNYKKKEKWIIFNKVVEWNECKL